MREEIKSSWSWVLRTLSMDHTEKRRIKSNKLVTSKRDKIWFSWGAPLARELSSTTLKISRAKARQCRPCLFATILIHAHKTHTHTLIHTLTHPINQTNIFALIFFPFYLFIVIFILMHFLVYERFVLI